MGILKNLSKVFKTPTKEEAEKSGDWATLLKMLSKCQSIQGMEELSLAIARVGNKEAARGLVTLVVQSYERGFEIKEKVNELSQDPQALLMARFRGETGINTIGYNAQSVRSPIDDLKEEMTLHFQCGYRALDALESLRATEELQAALSNPAYKVGWSSFRGTLESIQKENSV